METLELGSREGFTAKGPSKENRQLMLKNLELSNHLG